MKVNIQEFQESWADDFLKQKEIIQNALKDLDASIEHVGSTSVKGLGAKRTIDILVGLEKEIDLDNTIKPMTKMVSHILKNTRDFQQSGRLGRKEDFMAS